MCEFWCREHLWVHFTTQVGLNGMQQFNGLGKAEWAHNQCFNFALHSLSGHMVCQAFLAAVDTTLQLRRSGRTKAQFPCRDEQHYPLLWRCWKWRHTTGVMTFAGDWSPL